MPTGKHILFLLQVYAKVMILKCTFSFFLKKFNFIIAFCNPWFLLSDTAHTTIFCVLTLCSVVG